MLSLSIFHQPEVLDQPKGAFVWWGYGLYPERTGTYVMKRMDRIARVRRSWRRCLRHLRFDDKEDDHEVVDLHPLQPALRE